MNLVIIIWLISWIVSGFPTIEGGWMIWLIIGIILAVMK